MISLRHGFFGGFGMGGGSSMMILLIVVIGVVIYLFINKQKVRGERDINQKPAGNSDALEIAKTRLAKGEITIEEFEQIKKNLL